MLEKLRGFLAFFDEILARKLTKCFPSLIGLAHIELHHTAGDLSDLCDRLTGIEMDHVEGV